MHDTGLHGRPPGRSPVDLRQSLEPGAAHDQCVLQAAVSQLGQHRRPLLGALPAHGTEPEAEHASTTLEVDTDRHVDGAVDNL